MVLKFVGEELGRVTGQLQQFERMAGRLGSYFAPPLAQVRREEDFCIEWSRCGARGYLICAQIASHARNSPTDLVHWPAWFRLFVMKGRPQRMPPRDGVLLCDLAFVIVRSCAWMLQQTLLPESPEGAEARGIARALYEAKSELDFIARVRGVGEGRLKPSAPRTDLTHRQMWETHDAYAAMASRAPSEWTPWTEACFLLGLFDPLLVSLGEDPVVPPFGPRVLSAAESAAHAFRETFLCGEEKNDE